MGAIIPAGGIAPSSIASSTNCCRSSLILVSISCVTGGAGCVVAATAGGAGGAAGGGGGAAAGAAAGAAVGAGVGVGVAIGIPSCVGCVGTEVGCGELNSAV